MVAVLTQIMEAWSPGSMRLSMAPSFKRMVPKTRESLLYLTKGERFRSRSIFRTTSTFRLVLITKKFNQRSQTLPREKYKPNKYRQEIPLKVNFLTKLLKASSSLIKMLTNRGTRIMRKSASKRW